MKRKIGIATLLVFSVTLIFSVAMFLLHAEQQRKDIAAFGKLTRSVEQLRTQATVSKQDVSYADVEESHVLPEYAALCEENPDLWGWIKIDGTAIDYPVMFTPNDAEYYLRRNFQREYSLSGTPFLDGDRSDDGGNDILYGHNMKNGTMFADLLSYADEDFYQKHPTIQLDTLYERGSYSVVAAFYSKVYSKDDTDVFRYYQYTDLSDAERFAEFMDGVNAAALYDTNVSAEADDQLLTLSTCSYHTENGRFVVVAKKN